MTAIIMIIDKRKKSLPGEAPSRIYHPGSHPPAIAAVVFQILLWYSKMSNKILLCTHIRCIFASVVYHPAQPEKKKQKNL